MKEDYALGDMFIIPFDDIKELCLPETAKQKHYYQKDKRIARALFELGYAGSIKGETIILTPVA